MIRRVAGLVLLMAVTVLARGAEPAPALDVRILFRDGKPLPFATVQILGRTGVTVADADGRLRLPGPLPVPPFRLLVADAGGASLPPITIDAIPSEGPLEVVVGADLEELVDVVGAIPDAALPPAAARTLIGRGDLDARNSSQVIDAIGTLPGAGRLGDGVSAVPSLRGLAHSRTLLLLDDGRVSAERRAGPSATYIDAETLSEVEAVRGPGGVVYGSDAFGGVIRMRTRMPAVGSPSSVRYTALAGTNGDTRALSAEWSGPLAGGGAMVGASWRQADMYESPEGEVFNSDYETRGARAGYQRPLGTGVFSAVWRSDFGVDSGKPDIDSPVDRTTYPQEDSHRLVLGYEMPGGAGWSRLAWNIAWDDYELITRRDRVPTDTRGRRLSTADVDAKDLGVRFEAERGVGAASLVTGADLASRYDLHATNLFLDYELDGRLGARTFEVAVDDARRVDLGAFAMLQADGRRFGWGAGARYDRVTTRNRGGFFGDRSTRESVVSGFASGTAHLGRHVALTGQASRGFREALLSDRYFRGISGRGFVVGNPDIDPESSTQYDLALRGQTRRYRGAVYVFRYEIDDYIERFADGDNFVFRNRDRARLEGVEVELEASLPGRLEVHAGFSTLSGVIEPDRFSPEETPAADVTPHMVLLQVHQQIGERWSWMLRTASHRRDDRPGETERAIPGYTVFDASAAVKVSRALSIQVLGRNLGDKAYLASPDEAAPLAPGRSVELSLRGAF